MSETAAPARTRPAKPRVAVPPRASPFSDVGASPGPLTLASNLFAGEHGSFTQLLFGLSSPAPVLQSPGVPPPPPPPPPPSLFVVPPGISPGGLFSPTPMGQFGMSHQEVLAQVQAQANQSQNSVFAQLKNSLSIEASSGLQHTNSISSMAVQETESSEKETSAFHNEEASQRQDPSAPADRPADDGYNWRKYGQKTVKGSECPRSYYKCTFPNCQVKKKVEHALDGQISEIIYKGKHNHQPPQKKRQKESGATLPEKNEIDGNLMLVAQPNISVHAPSLVKVEQETTVGASEQFSDSNDGREVVKSEMRLDEPDDGEADSKRRNVQVSSQKTQSEQRIVVQTTSEVDLLDDGYRWRKYGQKVVKGNLHPRSYYKCTYMGCTVRKHIERAPTDPKAVITTYEGKHNHDLPIGRGSGQSAANLLRDQNAAPRPDKRAAAAATFQFHQDQ